MKLAAKYKQKRFYIWLESDTTTVYPWEDVLSPSSEILKTEQRCPKLLDIGWSCFEEGLDQTISRNTFQMELLYNSNPSF